MIYIDGNQNRVIRTKNQDDEHDLYYEFLNANLKQLNDLYDLVNNLKNSFKKDMKINQWFLNNQKIVNNKYFLRWYYWIQELPNKYYMGYANLTRNKYLKLFKQDENKVTTIFTCNHCRKQVIELLSDKFGVNWSWVGRKDWVCKDCWNLPNRMCGEDDLVYFNEDYVPIEDKTEYDIPLEILKSMPYKDYLLTYHWRITRKKTLKRAHYKCQICGSVKNLNVHHNTYENRGEEKDEDLIVLCENCHGKFHDKLID
jgi:hypothetical protein